jgi:hypothetical protein
LYLVYRYYINNVFYSLKFNFAAAAAAAAAVDDRRTNMNELQEG